MTDPAELAVLHVEALFRLDGGGRLVATNERPAQPAPRVFVARSPAGVLCHVREDVADELAGELTRLAHDLPALPERRGDVEQYAAIEAALARSGLPPRSRWHGPAFDFSTAPRQARGDVVEIADDRSALVGPFAEFRDTLDHGPPFLAVVRDGAVVSACFSARLAPSCAEAGVETLAAHRGRGHAAAVVSAWRAAIEEAGRTPLYSTSYDNTASRAVARRLGLRQYAETFSLT